jgi:hypothetical protein
MSAQAVEISEHRNVAALTPITPMAMLAQAIERGMPVETVDKLMALSERWEKNQSRRAFEEALAAARADFKPIVKNREVDFTSAKGRTNYRHEDLAAIANMADPILAKHGLSYRYRTTSTINEPITVTCIVFGHGHSEENTLSAGRDESGNKNHIQGVASTVTYLQRYTLKAALGLAASNDDDAKTADGSGDPVNEIQIGIIRGLIVETAADIAKFCKFMKVERIEDIPSRKYDDAVRALEAKRAKS